MCSTIHIARTKPSRYVFTVVAWQRLQQCPILLTSLPASDCLASNLWLQVSSILDSNWESQLVLNWPLTGYTKLWISQGQSTLVEKPLVTHDQ
jgi:hypothetical protein